MKRFGAALALLAACAEDPGPRLESVTPRTTAPGGIVMLTGARLCDGDCETAAGAIRIGYDNPVQAMILDYTDTAAMIRIPQITPVGATVLIATVNERASNAIELDVVAP